MAKVDAGDRFYASGCGLVGIPLGALISRLFGQATTFYAAAALSLSCVAVALNMRETLRREDRRPFTLAGATIGLGRVAASHHRPPALYQIHEHMRRRCL